MILDPCEGGIDLRGRLAGEPVNTGHERTVSFAFSRASFNQKEVVADEDGFSVLVFHSQPLVDDAMSGAFVVPLFDNFDVAGDGVADKDRLDEAQTVVAVGHGAGVDIGGSHADPDAEDEGTVGDSLAEGLGGAPLGVHVVGVEIASLSAVEDNVGFGDGATGGASAFADDVVFKGAFVHGCTGEGRGWYLVRGDCG